MSLDWKKFVKELEHEANEKSKIVSSFKSYEFEKAAALATQQTLQGLANAIKKAL